MSSRSIAPRSISPRRRRRHAFDQRLQLIGIGDGPGAARGDLDPVGSRARRRSMDARSRFPRRSAFARESRGADHTGKDRKIHAHRRNRVPGRNRSPHLIGQRKGKQRQSLGSNIGKTGCGGHRGPATFRPVPDFRHVIPRRLGRDADRTERVVYRIGSGAGFSGDRVDAPQSVVREIAAAGDGGAIIFETLGERTLALGQLARRNNPDAGYEPLLEQFLRPILASCIRSGIVIVGNFGAANPRSAAAACARMAEESGLGPLRLAVVEGDDMLGRADLSQAERWEGDGRLGEPQGELIALNVYLGARAIADAISAGAQVVVTGRVADPSLAVGPLVAHFGWDVDGLRSHCRGDPGRAPAGMRLTGERRLFRRPRIQGCPRPRRHRLPDRRGRGRRPLCRDESQPHGRPRRPADGQGAAPLRNSRSGGLSHPGRHARHHRRHARAGWPGPGRRGRRPRRPPPAKLKATASYVGDWLGEAEISYAGPNAAARSRPGHRRHRQAASAPGHRRRLPQRHHRIEQRLRQQRWRLAPRCRALDQRGPSGPVCLQQRKRSRSPQSGRRGDGALLLRTGRRRRHSPRGPTRASRRAPICCRVPRYPPPSGRGARKPHDRVRAYRAASPPGPRSLGRQGQPAQRQRHRLRSCGLAADPCRGDGGAGLPSCSPTAARAGSCATSCRTSAP